jgi:hypothetical protein
MVSVKDRDLNEMDEATRREKLRELVEATRRLSDDDVRKLDAEIAAYETKYGITSEQMQEELRTGSRQETNDICAWLLLLRRFDLMIEERVLAIFQPRGAYAQVQEMTQDGRPKNR